VRRSVEAKPTRAFLFDIVGQDPGEAAMASRKDDPKTHFIVSPTGDPIVVKVGDIHLVLVCGTGSEDGAALQKAWLDGYSAASAVDRQLKEEIPSLSAVRQYRYTTGTLERLVAKLPVIRIDPRTGKSD
jgi:hypothetical protein